VRCSMITVLIKLTRSRFVVTDDKEGPGSDFQKHLPDVSLSLLLDLLFGRSSSTCNRRRFSSLPLSILAISLRTSSRRRQSSSSASPLV
jgi:hypothetical protein